MTYQCPDCRNEFVQPFKCTTCGAQKLYDTTMNTLAANLARAEARLAEAERDAARYRFLRDQDGMGNIFIHTPTCELDATIDREIAADSADDVINAQHDETGRTWRGPRSQLPSRYFEVDEICCLDYPRCDCNSPPEPDNEWHCSQYPGCECFAGCREKALEAAP